MDSAGQLPMIEFRVLGPLQVSREGTSLVLRGSMLPRLLALLLCTPGESMSVARLIDEMWAGNPPPGAGKTLQVYVHRLRGTLGDGSRVGHSSAGYAIAASADELDALRFAALVSSARAERRRANLKEASRLYERALDMWRGEAYADTSNVSLVKSEAQRLDDQRLLACEEHAVVTLDRGLHGELVGNLTRTATLHPFRERLRAYLMLALYRAGRQAEALEVFRATRALVNEELGVEPDPALHQIHQAILCKDVGLDGPVDQILDHFGNDKPHRAVGSRPHVTGPGPGPDDDIAMSSRPTRPTPDQPNTHVSFVPRQVPADVEGFTGRHRELTLLNQLTRLEEDGTEAPRIIVVAGTPGVGKTALVVHWAHRAAARFPDGQLYADLRGYASTPPQRPIETLTKLLYALGVPTEQVPEDLDMAAGMYRSLLADRRMLVVLDNARTAAQVRPLLPAGATCMTVVTSRDRLRGLVAREGARRLTLGMLTREESCALLAHALAEDRVSAKPDALADLARSCAFLPLALRIAAANVAGDPFPDVAGYAARLRKGNRLAMLRIESDEGVAVRAAIDLSYSAQPEDVRRLFRLLGRVPGADVAVETAAALAGLDPGQAELLLRRLTDAHLVDQHAPGRFRFHDLLRLYAIDRARREDGAAERKTAIGNISA